MPQRPPEDLPVLENLDLPSRSVAAGRRGSPVRRCLWIGGLLGVLLLVVGAFLPTGHGHGHRVIRVTGRLLWEASQESIVGARVLAVSRYDLEGGWDPESAWFDVEMTDADLRALAEAGHEEDLWSRVGLYDYAGARSGAGGRIDFMVALPTTTWSSSLSSNTDIDDPADAVTALWIAPEGGEPVTILVDTADWRPAPDRAPDRLWGTYDVGTVVVPAGALSRPE